MPFDSSFTLWCCYQMWLVDNKYTLCWDTKHATLLWWERHVFIICFYWNTHTHSLVVSVCWMRSATKICQKLKAKWTCQWIFCKIFVSIWYQAYFLFCFVLSILLLFSNPIEEVDKVQMRLVCYTLFHSVWAKDNHLLQHRIYVYIYIF